MNSLSTTFYELLADNLAVRPDKTALIDRDREASYAELSAEADRIAALLAAAGTRPGDRVIVHMRKSIAEAASMFAAAKLGAVVVNVNAQWTLEQLGYVAEDCAARVLIVEPRVAEGLAGSSLPTSVARILVHGGVPDICDGATTGAPSPVPETVPRLDTELAAVMYTSGSTGHPKGVMLTHRNLVAGARSVARYLQLREDDRLLGVLPYSFDYGLNQLTTMMLTGGTVIHQPVAMASELVAAAVRHQATGIAAVPPLWAQIVRLLTESPTALPTLRRITNSGGKIPLNILERMSTVFPGVDIVLMYGLTESFRSTWLEPHKFAAKMGAIGRAIPGAEVYVIKPGGGVAGPGEQGELVHRGPLVSMGYWGRADATAEKIRPCPALSALIGDEPVVWSGDTVRVDEDGDLWFVARADAMIKTSGFRLSPDEVEDLVSRSGLVADAVAFGVEDDDIGQVVHVAVTPLPDFDTDALARHCRRTMAHYMVPRRFHLWTGAMPRTASGKLARPEIVAQCRNWLAAEQQQTAAE